MNQRESFRQMLTAAGPIVTLGVCDALSARIATEAGARSLYMSGYAVAATHARPDVGLLTMTEVVTRCREITAAVDAPLIVDADDGYGGLSNVARTVRELEQAGAVAVQLEDQPFPKRCGALSGLSVIPMEDMVRKIKVACGARRDPGLLIVARTDARLSVAFEAALDRAHAFEQAGADIIFFQMPQSADEIRAVTKSLSVPTLFTFSESLRVPLLPLADLADLGVKIVVYPLTLLMASITAMREAARRLLEVGTNRDMVKEFVPWPSVNDLLGLGAVDALESRYR